MFVNSMKQTLNTEFNFNRTENGALGYRTTGKALLDLNFNVPKLRNLTEQGVIAMFLDALAEDELLAIKWLFFARDAREGLGERRTFRIIVRHLAASNKPYMGNLIPYVAEYGRYDDLFEFMGTPYEAEVIRFIAKQLHEDLTNKANKQPISLLAKWMPSINTSSSATKALARKLAKALGLTARQYRIMLSGLRAHLNITECKMSANKWSEIDYEAVPSKANLKYNSAFLRKDTLRRKAFLSKVTAGEAKINASVLHPHEIVGKYMERGYGKLSKHDDTLEALWKALPNLVGEDENTLVVADGSGSMFSNWVGNVMPIKVANALAIYFAERAKGQFNNTYITFSERPQLVTFNKNMSLREKLMVAFKHNEIASTNIEAVFDLILRTAINGHLEQSELPKNILIISDMEFNSAVSRRVDERLFETIKNRYDRAGYDMPRLTFWNVASRTSTIPVIQNDLGVTLVSGFSVNILKMVMSNKTDPYEVLVDQLMSERYAPIQI